ncbi:MAG: choline/carnitine O-acyltransferase, partial [Promethearchaeia archaeon]
LFSGAAESQSVDDKAARSERRLVSKFLSAAERVQSRTDKGGGEQTRAHAPAPAQKQSARRAGQADQEVQAGSGAGKKRRGDVDAQIRTDLQAVMRAHTPESKKRTMQVLAARKLLKTELAVDDERLAPTSVRGAVPICMRQYQRFFCLTREPGRDTDTLRHYDSVHVAVQYKGTWWRVDCLTADKKPVSVASLKQQLDSIVSAVGSVVEAPAPGSPEANLPALTALNRTRWAEIREVQMICISTFRHCYCCSASVC